MCAMNTQWKHLSSLQLSVGLRNGVCLLKMCYLNTSEALKPQDVIYMTTFLKDCSS